MRQLIALILGSMALIGCAESPGISEAEMREEYRKVISAYEVKDYRLRHILLMTEGEAKEVLREIEGGESFAAIAKSTSRDTVSGRNGGDLGWTAPQMFGPELESAVRQFSSKGLLPLPIRSKFGWHVVEVLDIRPPRFPPFEDVKDEIESRMKERKAKHAL